MMLTRTVALAAAMGAVAAPAASAMIPPPDPPASKADVQPLVVQQAQPSKFDYDDAAIGAGVAFTVLLLGTGGGLALRRTRHPHVAAR